MPRSLVDYVQPSVVKTVMDIYAYGMGVSTGVLDVSGRMNIVPPQQP